MGSSHTDGTGPRHKHKHLKAQPLGLAAYDLAIITMELVALSREQKKKQLSQGKMERWLEDITAKSAPAVELPDGGVFIPNFSRKVTVRFEDPEVRKKLIKLINTDVVKVLDKDFMCNLQEKLYQSYWTAFEERLAERRKWESQRRKQLALDGIQPMEDHSLEKHPIMEVRREVERTFDMLKKKAQKPYQAPKRMTWDYRQFAIKSAADSVASDETEGSEQDVDLTSIERKKKHLDLKIEPSYTTLMSQEFYQRIKYEPPMIKDLKAAQTVNDLYSIAEKILDRRESHHTPLTEKMIKTGLKVGGRKSPEPEAAEVKPPEVKPPEVKPPEVKKPVVKKPEGKKPEGKKPEGKKPKGKKPAGKKATKKPN